TIWVAVQVTGTPPDPTEPTEPQPPTPTPVETEMPPEPTETEAPPEPTEEPGADLLNIVWVLDSYLSDEKDDDMTDVIEDVESLLAFDNFGIVTGIGGCNEFSGGYLTNGVDIIFEELRNTLMFCEEPEGVMDQESKLLEWLEKAETYQIVLDEQDHELLEILITVMEEDQQVNKVVLVFYDQQDGPPQK
ncbi:MAG: META domain-containing protein, partial [Anaerolineales bacterium]